MSVAARRALSSYFTACPQSVGNALFGIVKNDFELEEVLIAIDGSCRSNRKILHSELAAVVQKLKTHESLAVRNVARRICSTAYWPWEEIRDSSFEPRVLVETSATTTSMEESKMLVGGHVTRLLNQFIAQLKVLQHLDVDPQELASEFASQYSLVEKTHRMTDARHAGHWMRSADTITHRPTENQIGRTAIMRVLGRYALEGRTPTDVEEAYDSLCPIYDSSLHMRNPLERPAEFEYPDWDYFGGRLEAWLDGEHAKEWSHYPHCVDDLLVIGEVTNFYRFVEKHYVETRVRGILCSHMDAGVELQVSEIDETSLTLGIDRTVEQYRDCELFKPSQIVGEKPQSLALRCRPYDWVGHQSQNRRGVRLATILNGSVWMEEFGRRNNGSKAFTGEMVELIWLLNARIH